MKNKILSIISVMMIASMMLAGCGAKNEVTTSVSNEVEDTESSVSVVEPDSETTIPEQSSSDEVPSISEEPNNEAPIVEEVENELDIAYINDFYGVNFNFDKVVSSSIFPDNMCEDEYMLYMVSNIDSFYDGSIFNDKILNRNEILEELNISSNLYTNAIAIRSEDEMRFCYIFKYNGDYSEIKAALVRYVDKLLEDNLDDEKIAARINCMTVTACKEEPYVYLVYEVRDEESDAEDDWTLYCEFDEINFKYNAAIYDVLKYAYLKDVKYAQ